MAATTTAPAPDAPAGKSKGGKKKKKLVIVAVVLLVVLGAAYFLVLAPKGKAAAGAGKAPAAAPTPVPGAVLRLDPVTVNLADGHYLRVGLALQLTTKGDPKVMDGSKALDAAIGLLSGQSPTTLTSGKGREALKRALSDSIRKAYPDQVMGVYFTDFVTQ